VMYGGRLSGDGERGRRCIDGVCAHPDTPYELKHSN
jgi:hypothetical protein